MSPTASSRRDRSSESWPARSTQTQVALHHGRIRRSSPTPRWPGDNANEREPDDRQRTWRRPHPGQPAHSRWQGVVRMQDSYDTETDDLWSAFTDPRRLARWIGEV